MRSSPPLSPSAVSAVLARSRHSANRDRRTHSVTAAAVSAIPSAASLSGPKAQFNAARTLSSFAP
jgi:hypothetical protein